MTDRGLDSWTEGLTARERVRKIARSLTGPRSVEWIRTEADVSSWQTTKDELEMLVDFEQLLAVDGSDGNRTYAPNYQRRYFSELSELIDEHSRAELREEIAEIQDTLESWQSAFDVRTPAELESTLSDELSSAEIRRRNRILREWERRVDNKRLLRHALELYDDARSARYEDDHSVSISQ